MDTNKFGYFSKTVADQLGIKPNTLGKWARELERFGIEFEKNESNHRVYYDRDVRAFEEMKKQLDLQRPLLGTAKYITEEIEKGRFDEALEDDNALIPLGGINTNPASITPQSHMGDFKSEIISSVLDGMKGELAPLLQQIQQIQQPQQVDMLPNHSEQAEKLQQILDAVQKLQEVPPDAPNASVEKKYQQLLEEHNRIIDVHNQAVTILHQMQGDLNRVSEENAKLKTELERWRKKSFWKNPFWKKNP